MATNLTAFFELRPISLRDVLAADGLRIGGISSFGRMMRRLSSKGVGDGNHEVPLNEAKHKYLAS